MPHQEDSEVFLWQPNVARAVLRLNFHRMRVRSRLALAFQELTLAAN
jgi:hypothetical protein